MRKVLTILFVFAALLAAVLGVSADQNGNDKWCNVDEYGCWVTDEDGGKSYINFWSEPARKYIMGEISEPCALVVAPLPLDEALFDEKSGHVKFALESEPAEVQLHIINKEIDFHP